MDQEDNTKEIIDLEELREKSDDDYVEEMELEEELDSSEETLEEMEMFEEEESETEENLEEQPEEKQEKETEKKKKEKKSIKEKWLALSKKKKIIIIVSSIIVLLILVALIVFLVFHNKKDDTVKAPDVILEQENYRYQNGKLIFLDKNEKELGSYDCEHQDQETCYVAFYNDEDNFDEPKIIYEGDEKVKTRADIVLEQYAWVYDNDSKEDGNIFLFDFKNQKKISEYEFVKGYTSLNNEYIVKNEAGEYNFIRLSEEKMELVIPTVYDYLGIIDSKEQKDTIVAKRGSAWFLLDYSGNMISKEINGEIKGYNSEQIKYIDASGKYHLVGYDGTEKKKDSYDYIDLLDNHVLLIQNNAMFVEDYSGNKMNVEGIGLKNSSYLEVNIYSKKGKKIETQRSYNISYQGSTMVIEVLNENGSDGEKTSINLNEGRISSSLAYLDYFNGKLYFYNGDNNLLGSYTCENKNNISDDTSSLNHCMVASESFYADNDLEKDQSGNLGILPIYNERYVFIQDSKNPQEDSNIVLYDLKENAVKSKYKSIDAASYNKADKIGFVSANNTHIIAENKNGKVGIIRMNYDKVEGVKGFDFDHIERSELYYITHNESGYQLMDHSGNMLSSAVTNKIRNFDTDSGYLTVKDSSSKYYLYDMSGKKITEIGYDYISLYKNHFGAVKNKTLQFYSYKEPEIALGKEITLKQTNYYGEGILAYTAVITGNIATVNIGSGNRYETEKVSLIEVPEEDDEDADRTE